MLLQVEEVPSVEEAADLKELRRGVVAEFLPLEPTAQT
jgi:hypothetical protein